MTTNTRVFGYGRVSSKGQNLDRQIEAFKKMGILERDIYTDKASGKDFDRENYKALKKVMRVGDTLIIYSLDRLGRNYTEIRKEWEELTKEICVKIKVLDMPLLDTTKAKNELTEMFIADLVLQVLSYVAENERNNIRARQEQGIKIAKEKGIKFGRPQAEYPEEWETEYNNWKSGNQTAVDTMKHLGLKKTTFYKLVKTYENN